ncbi:ParB/RepB/Spo0J family partition protein, partial [uncultured Corynebacterium sp.]|uniref:ParB/RepB/Spo0J family partition protein n=1 Tax=uncultured Corynebacterium sp. TaxID=159447 RepID=UPI002614E468
MPSPNAVGNSRRGGLGRGLASLIPSGPARPSLGDGAADIVLGSGKSIGIGGNKADAGSPSVNGGKDDRPVEDAAKSQKSPVNPQADQSDSDKPTFDRPGETRSGTSGMDAKRHSDASRSVVREATGAERDASEGRSATMSGVDVSRETLKDDFGATYQELPLDAIRTNAKQPREVFDEEALQELVHSIKEFGLMQPIVVRRAPDEDSTYELIMGERRLRAAKRAGFEVIPAIVRETADDEMLRDALLENIHRVQLNPLEEAAAYQQLMEEFGVTQEQLAKKIGRSRPLITNMIRLLQLPVSVQRRVGAGVLSAGHARALLGLKSGAEEQEKLATRVVSEGLSVRATEEAVTLLNRGDKAASGTKVPGRNPQQLPEDVSNWVDNASDALETKVSVQMGKKKGKIVVEFGGPEDFD